MPELEIAISVTSIMLTVIGLLFQYFKVILGLKERMATLETKINLFWSIVEREIPRLLKDPTGLTKDGLLDKFAEHHSNGMTLQEMEELTGILECELKEKKMTNTRRIAYALIVGRLKQLIYEKKGRGGK